MICIGSQYVTQCHSVMTNYYKSEIPACVLRDRPVWQSDQRDVVSDVLHVVVRVGNKLRGVNDLPAALCVVEVVSAQVDVGTLRSEHQHSLLAQLQLKLNLLVSTMGRGENPLFVEQADRRTLIE